VATLYSAQEQCEGTGWAQAHPQPRCGARIAGGTRSIRPGLWAHPGL